MMHGGNLNKTKGTLPNNKHHSNITQYNYFHSTKLLWLSKYSQLNQTYFGHHMKLQLICLQPYCQHYATLDTRHAITAWWSNKACGLAFFRKECTLIMLPFITNTRTVQYTHLWTTPFYYCMYHALYMDLENSPIYSAGQTPKSIHGT